MLIRRSLIYSALFFVLILIISLLGGAFFEDKLFSPYFSAGLTVLTIVGLGSYVDFGKSFISWVENIFFKSKRGFSFFLLLYLILFAMFMAIFACSVTKHYYRSVLSSLVPDSRQAGIEFYTPLATERVRYLAVNFPNRDDWKMVLDAVSNTLRRDDAQYRKFNRFIIEAIFAVPDAEKAPAAAFDFGKLPVPKWYCWCNVSRAKFTSFELFVMKFAAQGLANNVEHEGRVTQRLLTSAPDGAETGIYRAIFQLGERLDALDHAIESGTAVDKVRALERGRTSAHQLNSIFSKYPKGTLADSDVYLLAHDFLAQLEIFACHLEEANAVTKVFAAYEELLDTRKRGTVKSWAAPVWFYEPQKFTLYTFVSNFRARSLQHQTDKTFDHYTRLCSEINTVLVQLQTAFPSYWGNNYDQNWRKGTVAEKPLSQMATQVLNTQVYQGWRTN